MARQEYDTTSTPVTHEAGTGKFVIAITFAATCVLVGGMILDNQRVTLALTCGITFFSFLVVMVMLVQTGQLVSAVNHYQTEKTQREQARLQYEVYLREVPALAVPEPALLREVSDVQVGKFVPARPPADEALRVQAYSWVMPLFREGLPDPERILSRASKSPGQVQAKKPGEEVLSYLLGLEMVRGGGKGEMLFFNQETYTTLRKCQQAIKYGVPLRGEGGG